MSTGPTVEVAKTYATVDITAGGATVTVDVPETTVSITAPGPQGPAGTGADGYLLQAYDTTDQIAASTTTAYPILLGTVDISDGITVANNGSSQPTRITFANDGDYNIQFSIQFQNSGADDTIANVWFRKNGTDIPQSNSQTSVPKKHGGDNGSLILAANLIVAAAAGDYVELYWQTEANTVSIQALSAGTTPTTPATPSVIVTAMVNRYLEVGPAGPGVPTGGTTGQVLIKNSGTNYDTAWANGGLRLIKTVTIGSGVSTVVVTNAFSASFNNYRVVINDPVGSITYQTELRLVLGSTTSAYYGGFTWLDHFTSLTRVSVANGSYCPLAQAFNSTGSAVSFDITSPYASRSTTWSGTHANGSRWGDLGGNQLSNTSFTDFTINTGSGTLTGGTIRVYGYCE